MAAPSPAVSRERARIAGLKRAVRNGERPADCPELVTAERELKVAKLESDADRLAQRAREVVETWPDLTPAQLGRIATILQAGGAA